MHRLRQSARSLVLGAALWALLAPAWPQQVRDVRKIPRVEPRISTPRPAFPAGEPLTVELVLRNPSEVPVEVPGECLKPSAFDLRAPGAAEPDRARKDRGPEGLTLAPGQSVRQVYELTRHFKGLRKTGHHWISWSCGSWKAPMEHLFVVRPYDPSADKAARIVTSLGDLEIVFIPEQAPLHVRTFAELAGAGYYDGLRFERLVPGLQVEVGDRSTSREGRWEHQLPPEIDDRIVPGKGLVGAVRRESSMTSATRFFILLDTATGFAGLHTFFAYVRTGGEVLEALKGRDVLGDAGPGAFLLKEPVRIERIEILPE